MKTISTARKHATPGLGLGLGQLAHLYDVWKSRRALATLTDVQLDDIGLSRKEARREANRAPWDAPATWRRT